MYQDENNKILSPYELAQAFTSKIKGIIAEKFSLASEDLSLLLEDKDGVYVSKEEPDTLCCLVLGEKNGYLYLVTAKMTEGGKSLDTFKCDVIS